MSALGLRRQSSPPYAYGQGVPVAPPSSVNRNSHSAPHLWQYSMPPPHNRAQHPLSPASSQEGFGVKASQPNGYIPTLHFESSPKDSRELTQLVPGPASHRFSGANRPSRDLAAHECSECSEAGVQESTGRLTTLVRGRDGGIQNEHFTMVVGIIILANTLCMAIETDVPDWPYWREVNNLFLLFFVFEIVARMVAYRCAFWCPSSSDAKELTDMWCWNMFDLTIVVMSVLDLWVKDIFMAILMPDEFTGKNKGQVTKYVMVLRMLRILRILRVLRLFQSFKKLLMLVNGIFETMQLVIWIALLMFMIMLVFAIFLTDMVGMRADDFPEKYRDDIRKYWGGVIRSMITLFQYLTMDDWSHISYEVVTTLPYMTCVFDLYIFMQAFSMLSLLTGVIAEHMGEVSQNMKDEEENEMDKDLRTLLHTLREEHLDDFHREDVSPEWITRRGFEEILSQKETKKKLKALGVEVHPHEMNDFWDLLDKDDTQYVNWQELTDGLIRLRGDLQDKDLLRMRCAAERVARRLAPEDGPEAVRGKLEKVQECMTEVDGLLANLTVTLNSFLEQSREDSASEE